MKYVEHPLEVRLHQLKVNLVGAVAKIGGGWVMWQGPSDIYHRLPLEAVAFKQERLFIENVAEKV